MLFRSLAVGTLALWLNASPLCYTQGYGELIAHADHNHIVLSNGLTLPYTTSAQSLTWDEKMNHADLAMQVSQSYNQGGIQTPPAYLFDPGRLRYQPFFHAVYGKDKQAIENNLVTITWPTLQSSRKLRVNRVGGVDKKLYAIGQEIAQLPKSDRIWAEGATTYCYRVIKDTNRLSMHSFGVAIDLAPTKTQYWKSESPSETAHIGYHNTMPMSIVRIFEKHGFIWGGRWYHYDTMHFEYRPELLAPACNPHACVNTDAHRRS